MPLKTYKRNRIWWIRGTVRGQYINETTETDNEALAETIRAQRESRLIDDSVFGKKATATFEEAVVSYLESGGSPRFIGREMDDGTRTGLLGHFYGWQLHAIAQADLDGAARKLLPTASSETRNRQVYTPFIAVWNSAVKNQKADVRLWQRPRKVKGTAVRSTTTRSGTKPVSYERAWQFVSVMSPAPAMVMTTLFYTGMRPIELFALQPDDLDVNGRWIVIQSSKTGPGRGVPMHEMLVPMLSALKERGGDAVFLTPRGEPYPLLEEGGGQLKTAVSGARRRLKNAGSPVNDVSPYTGRHSVSTQLVINGVHPYIKDQILGHVADDMSRHYTNLPQKPLIEAINTLPTVDAWANSEWLRAPTQWQGRLTRWVNYGRRGSPPEATA